MKKEFIYRLFSHIPELHTKRLLMRGLRVSDAQDMFEYSREHSVTEYLTWSPHPNLDFTREYLTYIGQRYRTGDFFDWGCVYSDPDMPEMRPRMIGTCGFTRFDFPSNSAEIGYVFNPAFTGRGLATEAVRRVIRFGFCELGLNRIEAKYMEGNESSRRMMERVGMTFEGYFRESMLIKGSYRTIGVCSLLKKEYDALELSE